jgi:II/X family phage/plasmid replication protein
VIDWLTFIAPLQHERGDRGPFYAGEVMCTKPDPTHPDGIALEWAVLKRKPVAGSFSKTIFVQSTTDSLGNPAIWVSGNPAKWLQGHNIFGSGDLRGLVLEMLHKVCLGHGLTPSAEDVARWDAGAIQLTRVDVTESYSLDTEARVLAALQSLDRTAHLKHRGRGIFKGESLTFGKGSRRSSLTLYAKGPELRVKGHELPELLRCTSLPAFAAALLRAEVRLLSMELKRRGLDWLCKWDENTGTELHREFLAGLELAEASMLDPKTLEGLPARYHAVYQLWADGHDLRRMYPKRTFYRHRNALLAHGIDIAIKQERTGPDLSNVVPLRVVLNGVQVGVPDWAVGTPLYFEPRAKVA